MGDSGKWVEDVAGDGLATAAASGVLARRLNAVSRQLGRADRFWKDDKYPHELRVSTRRAEAALDAFEPCLPRKRLERIRERLRRLRRAAGDARDQDVQTILLAELAAHAPADHRPAIDSIVASLKSERRRCRKSMRRALAGFSRRKFRRSAGKLRARIREPRGIAPVSGRRVLTCELGARRLLVIAAKLRDASRRDLSRIEDLHTFRLAGKQVRYALEVFGKCIDARVLDEISRRLEALQDGLGNVRDLHGLIVRLREARDACPPTPAASENGEEPAARAALDSLIDACESLLERRNLEAVTAVLEFDADGFVDEIAAALGHSAVHAPGFRADDDGEPGHPPAPVHAPLAVNGHGPAPAGGGSGGGEGGEVRRLAAIDVGTNTIRLLVAEARPDGSYRTIDDEREAARLGRGLVATGTLSEESMERTVRAVARMKSIAEGYGAHTIRVIGTSAVREAANRETLIALLRDRAGVDLHVIEPEEEARLAFLSVSHAFDLRGVAVAVADIGGGSTEVVLAADGVTESVHSLRLGAVRLTEQFGGTEASSGERYKEMRRYVKRQLKDSIGRPAIRPQLLIGTGGTFTALANMLIQAENGPGDPALPWKVVPGYEAHRADIRHALARVRGLPLRDRARVPGLPAERADIIVAGLVIVDTLLKRLGVNIVRVHDRGIRDGLIISLASELFPRAAAGAARSPDPMRAVRRLADSCHYERAHSEHVTRLALSIYDQMRSSFTHAAADDAPLTGVSWTSPASRRLLEAAGVLHDIGYLINYAGHHLHGYHLIMHGDLPGFTRREVEIIANVARYHRRGAPRKSDPNFAALAKPDRALVRRLVGILRIADGLDRTHTQAVRSVEVAIEGTTCRFTAQSPSEPATDLWGAERKADVFARAFSLAPALNWARSAPAATGREAPAPAHSAA